MDDFAGWVPTSSEAERLAAFWLAGDVFITPEGAPPWTHGDVVGLCDLQAQTPYIANLRATTGDCPGE